MKLKKITIENFRSYYGTNIIEVGEGLTLLIGSNGDGKTTLYDALDWLFGNSTIGDVTRIISQKKIAEMMQGDSSVVRVSIDFEHNDSKMMLERKMPFNISFEDSINTAPVQCQLFEVRGSERIAVYNGADRFNKAIFDQSIRRYCLFKGESELNVFNGAQALQNLIETFSDIRKFDPYVEFTDTAASNATTAANRAMVNNKKIQDQSKNLLREIETATQRISECDRQKNIKIRDKESAATFLESLEQNKEIATQIKDINGKLSTLSSERSTLLGRLKENYTIRLLDDMWILMGFEKIAKEYLDKVAKYDKAKRKMHETHLMELGAKKFQQQLLNGAVPLAPYIPDEKTMREMLDDHVCKVCGTLAPEGSKPYEFMKQRLEDYMASIKQEEEYVDDMFPEKYIDELTKRGHILNNEMDRLSAIQELVVDGIELNVRIKGDIAKKDNSILDWEEKKKQLLAQVPGVTEDALINDYQNISNWWNIRSDAEQQIRDYEDEIKDWTSKKNDAQLKLDQLAATSPAAIYSLSAQALRKIHDAFENAQDANRKEFLTNLEAEANHYLELLNKYDFRGLIRLVELPEKKVRATLVDSNSRTISNPNTALATTMYMSILFAVAKLTTIQRNNDYPLIFDAPTSSFTEAKEADFFKIIGDIKKQVIIVTKSFLSTGTDNKVVLDESKLKGINGTIYRLSKMEPYDAKNIATIQTIITKIQ